MSNRLLGCLCGALVLAAPAWAQQDDTPYAYPDEEPVRPPPRPPQPRPEPRTGPQHKAEKFESLARLDDPNTGLAFEALGGALLLDSSRGAAFEALPAVGARFTWEYGRLFATEALREALWVDVQWTFSALSAGTALVSGDTRLHYATVAPAYELTFGPGSAFGVYAQVGGGVAFQQALLRVGSAETELLGLKPLFQYGVGLRGRPRLSSNGTLSLAFRLELTRLRRDYMNDTLVAGSVGLAF